MLANGSKLRWAVLPVILLLLLSSAAWNSQAQVDAPAAHAPAMDAPIVESPHPYANDYEGFWTVEMAGADATRIHFSRIELEEYADYLVISDPGETRTQIITGNHPDGLWTDPIPGTTVRIRLVSDVNVRKWGFAVDQKESVAYSSILRSPHPYHNDTDQSWTVLNGDAVPGEATRLHFSNIDLEENVDWLVLCDIDGNPYQYITGSHPSGLWSIGIPGIAVKLRLVSDGTVERWGFNVDAAESATSSAPIPPPGFTTIAESDHPYTDGTDEWWTIINPNVNAVSTKVHLSRLELGNYDRFQILDADDRLIQEWVQGNSVYDYGEIWSDYVPGRIVKLHLIESNVGTGAWGFRIDRVADGENLHVWAQSDHPYADGTDEWWTIINPNVNAVSTKVHLSRLELGNYDRFQILDADDRLIQEWVQGNSVYDYGEIWSDYVPGRIVKLHLIESNVGTGAWGFRIDRVADGENLHVWAQSDHPYADGTDEWWTIVNPNLNADSTRVHFSHLELGNYDRLQILDAADTVVQEWTQGNSVYNYGELWSDYVTGRIVRIHLNERDVGSGSWGFRIDDLYPATDEPITPAAINGVYIQVNHPGTIYLNGSSVAHVEEAGEYKIWLPGEGTHTIRIEYLEYTQDIVVTLSASGASIVYLPVVERNSGQ